MPPSNQRGISVSPSDVCSIWLPSDLATFKQRLSAMEKVVAEQGILLTEDRWRRWREIWPMAKSKPLIPAILGRRIRFTSGPQGRWPNLLTDLCGYLQQGGDGQALDDQDTDHGHNGY
jgi:hypothetical protein